MNSPEASTSTAGDSLAALRVVANARRMQIVEWLLDPTAHFPPQVDGDLTRDGVCLGAIVRKIDLAQPTVTAHMKALTDAGLVGSKRIKNWTFFKADRAAIDRMVADLATRLRV